MPTSQPARAAPGPWSIYRSANHIVYIRDAHGATVGAINRPDPVEEEATARLIAAAPELLFALQEIVKQGRLDVLYIEDVARLLTRVTGEKQ